MTPTVVDIPVVGLGPAEVPRLFLGDHGYLAKLDSVLTVDEVVASMRMMLASTSVGIAAGETRVIDAAIRALGPSRQGRLMVHADTQALLQGDRIRYRDLAATTTCRLAEGGLTVGGDLVLGFLAELGVHGRSLPPSAAGDLQLDERTVRTWEADIKRAQPAIVSVGGDWMDFLLLVGRMDLAIEGVGRLAGAAASVGAAVLATTYVGSVVEPSTIASIVALVDGVLLPLNHLGFGMLPTAAEHLAWIQQLHKPVVGMHVLAGGLSPGQALSWLNVPQVAALVVGASSDPHQLALARAANDFFAGVVL